MATVHPSRLNLIPQGLREPAQDNSRGRSSSPRRSRRSPSPRRRDGDRDRDRARDDYDSRSKRYDHGEDRKRDRESTTNRGRDSYRENDRALEPRRSSPQYEDYKRPQPPSASANRDSAPWRQQDNMYTSNHSNNPYHGSGSGSTFLEARRVQRAALSANPWPASPKAPARELSPKGKKSGKKSKRHRSPSPDGTDSSEEDRKRRKERKRSRKVREKEERKEKKHRSHRSRSQRRYSDEEESEDERRHSYSKHRSKHSSTRSPSLKGSRTRSKSKGLRPRTRSRTPSRERMEVDRRRISTPERSPSPVAPSPRAVSTGPTKSAMSYDGTSDEDIGPQPLQVKQGIKKVDERAYGGALLRGEGSAMAAFLQEDPDTRIPRRGEIGLTSDEIAKFEDVGYVMSGSRHRRMNAVRMRKENQVISAEEKRGILKLQKEERQRKEAILRDEFSQLVTEKLKASTS